MNSEIPVLKSNWLEVYFGLFGPELSYHTNNYNDEYPILVISLVLFKLYITVPFKHKEYIEYDNCKSYGFYCTNKPVDTLMLQWGYNYKSIVMPWARVVVDKYIYDEYMQELNYHYPCIYGFSNNLEYVIYPEIHWFQHDSDEKIKYNITRLEFAPNIFSKFKWFLSSKYLIEVKIDNSIFTFTTTTLVCIQKQIDFQIEVNEYLNSNQSSY